MLVELNGTTKAGAELSTHLVYRFEAPQMFAPRQRPARHSGHAK